MGRKSNYYAKKVLNKMFGATDFTAPATLYFGLLVDNNTDDQRAAATYTEVAFANAYARAAITNNPTNFPDAVDGTITVDGVTVAAELKHCAIDITWPTATGAWGFVRAWGIFDGPNTGANLLEFASVDTAQSVVINNTPYLSATTGFSVSER